MEFHLYCVDCGHKHDNSKYRIHCEICDGLLDVQYSEQIDIKNIINYDKVGTARYLSALPIRNPSNLITMGEGNTPVIPLDAVGKKLGLSNLQGKLEYLCPTGSFKDRGNVVQVSVLKETGVKEIVDPIGGNAGHSMAAYCARAGIKIFGVADEAKRGNRKLHAIEMHGVEMSWTNSGTQGRVEGARRLSEDTGVMLMDYGKNIYFIEGLKTMAYEIAEQIDPLPDHIIVPIGNGSIYHGLYKGFVEMLASGRIERIPQLHGTQTDETQPFVAAFQGKNWTDSLTAPTSLAGGVSVPDPPRLDTLVDAARKSFGSAVAVTEDKILSWQRDLAAMEGIIVEPTSAVVLAATEQLVSDGHIKSDDRVLVPLTGFGLKEAIPGF